MDFPNFFDLLDKYSYILPNRDDSNIIILGLNSKNILYIFL